MAKYEWVNGNPHIIEENGAIEGQLSLDDYIGAEVDKLKSDRKPVAQDSKEKAKELLSAQSVRQTLIADEVKRDEYFETLLKTELSLQSNEFPLKKGGTKIGYRPDVIIFANRSQLSDEENILFDMASALVSSKPDDEYYVIYPQDYAEDLPIPKNHFYEKIKKAAVSDTEKGTGINTKPLIFKTVIENPDDPSEYEERTTEIHMFEVMTYQSVRRKDGKRVSSRDEVKNSAILFKPTKAMKALMISSSLTHGAHYNIMLPMGLVGYSKKMYYLLESRKSYRKYETAEEGVFEIDLEEFRELLGIPASYNFGSIETYILKRAQRDMAEIEDMPFNFEYEPVDEKTKRGQTKHVGIRINIVEKGTETVKTEQQKEEKAEKETAPIQPIEGYEAEKSLISAFGYNESEIQDILRDYIRNERELMFLSQALGQVAAQSGVKSKVALMCSFMQNGFRHTAKEEKNAKEAPKDNMIEKPDADVDFEQLIKEATGKA